MAKLRFFDNMFEDKFQEIEFNKSKTLNEQIVDFSFNNAYSDYIVECYDPETGNTFYAPLDEKEGESSILITVNGVQVSENYKVEDNDIINIVYLPLAWDWRIFGTTIAGALLGGGLMFLSGFLTGGLSWSLAIPTALGLIEGGITGWLLGDSIFKNSSEGKYEDEKTGEAQPDVRGSENQPITGNNFPFVIGKHLVSPFILGNPYTEYSGEDGKDAYIRESLIVGYAPLCLTDFKLGDFWLAYNRTSTVNRETILNGLLKGYSTGGVADNGDIVDIWKNNDIELEILQQHPDKPVNYGTIYPNKVVDKDVNANSLFVCDKSILDVANITYKGTSFPNNYRTNTVQFSESCPKKITVTLDFPQGLYSSHTHTEGSEAKNIYGKIPLWIALQWRPYNKYNSSSKSDGSDCSRYDITNNNFNNWHTDWIVNNSKIEKLPYTKNRYENDIGQHLGNDFSIDEEISMIDGNSVADFTFENLISVKSFKENGAIYGSNLNSSQTFTWKAGTGISGTAIQSANMYSYQGGYQTYIRDYSGITKIGDKSVSFMIYQLHPNWFANREHYLCISLADITEAVSDNKYFSVRPIDGVRNYPVRSEITLNHCSLYMNEKLKPGQISPKIDPDKTDVTVTAYIDYISADFEIVQCTQDEYDSNRICGNWLLKYLYNVGELSGKTDKHDGTKEMRVSFTREFTKEECKQFSEDPDNTINGVEVRLVRVSPNYLNQTIGTTTDSAYQYQDTVTWKSLVTEVYDENKLLKEDKLEAIPVLSEKDMRKFCCISIKAKADSTGMVQQAMKKTNCVAQSFSPIWKKNDDGNYKWFPENISKRTVYYGYYDKEDNPCNRATGTDENPVIEKKISKTEYEIGRQKGYNWIMAKEGSNFQEEMLREVLGTYKEGTEYNILDVKGRRYLETNSASGFMLACVGGQNGAIGLGYEDINLLSIADSFDFNKDVTDGSTYTVPTVFNGISYDKGDLAHVKFEANGYIYQGRKLEDLLKTIAISCRSSWSYDEDGKICLITDKKQDFVQGVINQQNTITPSNTYTYSELPAGLAFNFSDENDGYEQNSVYCWDDGYSLENYHGQVESYSFDLVTNPAQIWSLGRYVLACRLLQREALSRKIGPEGHTYSLGDIVLVQSDELLLGGGSGRVQEVISDGFKIYGVITDTPYMYKNNGEGVTVVQSKFNGASKALTYEVSEPKVINFYRTLTNEIAPKNWNYEPEDYFYKVNEEYIAFNKDTIKPYEANKYYQLYTYTLKKGRTNVVLFKTPVNIYNGDDYSFTTEQRVNIKTGDIVLYGLYNQISQKYKIVKIKQDKDNTFTEALLPYFDELYNYGKPLPSFQSTVTMPAPMVDPVTLSEVQSVEERINAQTENINQSQVNWIEIVSENGFIFKKTENGFTPPSITLTAKLHGNLSHLIWYKNDVAISNDQTITVTPDDVGVYKAVSAEYSDSTSIVTLQDGSGITILCDNENLSIPTDNDVSVSVDFSTTIGFKVYFGVDEKIPGRDFSVNIIDSSPFTITELNPGKFNLSIKSDIIISRAYTLEFLITIDEKEFIKKVSVTAAVQGISGKNGGYQDYLFTVGAFNLTDIELRALTWYDAPPPVTKEKPCLYMATKWIEG